MGCVVGFDGHEKGKKIIGNRIRQKIMIDALLCHSPLDVGKIAQILEVSPETVQRVHQGSIFLADESLEQLWHLFLIMFKD